MDYKSFMKMANNWTFTLKGMFSIKLASVYQIKVLINDIDADVTM